MDVRNPYALRKKTCWYYEPPKLQNIILNKENIKNKSTFYCPSAFLAARVYLLLTVAEIILLLIHCFIFHKASREKYTYLYV